MIDNKKIEEAARLNTDKYRNYPTLSDEDRDKVSIYSFMEGAKWMQEEFLKNLWYSISEEPKKGRVFLYKTVFKGYGLNQIINGNEWKYIIKYQKATKWLYVDDLFPKEGGEQ